MRAAADPGRGAVDLAGTDNHRVRALKFIILAGEAAGELTERDVVPAARLGIGETELLAGGGDYADARFGQVAEKIAQHAVVGDETPLLPQGSARRRRHVADDHIANLARGVASDDVNDFGSAHGAG